MKKSIYLSLLALCSLGFSATAQQFVNGSFETNTATACNLNRSNTQFNSLISGVTAFGLGENLDLIKDSCTFGAAQDGQYYIGLAEDAAGKDDAFTLSLTSPLVVGQNYTITYYTRKDINYPAAGYTFGYAPDSVRGGMILNTVGAPTDTAWHKEGFTFLASQAYRFISVIANGNNGDWTHMDNFTLSLTPTGIGNEQLNSANVTVYPNPATSTLHVALLNTSNQNTTVILTDIAGRVIKSLLGNNSSDVIIDLVDVAPGTYLVKCFNEVTSCSKMVVVTK